MSAASFVRDDRAALLAIHAILDGTEWSVETVGQIADVLRAAGFAVRDVAEEEWLACNDGETGEDRATALGLPPTAKAVTP